jgi:hypothetical protein
MKKVCPGFYVAGNREYYFTCLLLLSVGVYMKRAKITLHRNILEQETGKKHRKGELVFISVSDLLAMAVKFV